MNDFLKKKYQCLIFILCFLVLVYFTYRRNLSYINEMNTDKLYCGVAAVRALFMDKQYARSFGFVYPNMISFIAYFLTIILILWMIEENKNFKYDEYTFIKYRLSKIGFINKMVIDSIKKVVKTYICFLIVLCICSLVGNFNINDFLITIMYYFRLSLLILLIYSIRQSALIFNKNEKFAIYQYFILLILLILDMYLDLELVVMSSDIIYELKYIVILMIIYLSIYLLIKKLYVRRKEYL